MFIVQHPVHMHGLLPFNQCKAFQSHCYNRVDGASEGNLGERQDQGEEVGDDLVAVGLTEQGEGEDGKVEEDTETVKDAQVGNESSEGTLETKVNVKEHSQSGQIP